MNHSTEPDAQDLSRSFHGLLRQGEWQLDVEASAADSGADAPPAPVPAAVAPHVLAPEPPPVARIIEAMLFLGGVALTCERAAEVVRGLTPEQFQAAADELNRAYSQQGRPYRILRHETGCTLTLRPNFRFVIEKLAGGIREARLSTAAVEALAVVAYRQPVSKQEVDTLRGHESGALLRQLVRRGLVTLVSRAEASGREVLYGTTSRFLELFGLKDLDDLPRTEDLQRM